ncbi:hypothetical protein V496_05058 [Pseudogymnoascus sp. VKM F-4515 (FW-2607)]|nr:hypothetical protein V496_05058 [Pseudogymnoascus sp. VKM F-4515 (FW-2607)]KFY88477.1 hypothetical protein V498_06780 [Pseudogymnoascus sp. VKM F-4517 (FW-2822)]
MPMVLIAPLFLIVAGPPIAGAITDFCHKHPNPFCEDMGKVKRDIIDMSDVPKLNVERAAVGPCNIPMYNFDLCRDQLKSQTIQVVSSIPSPGVGRFDNIPPACMNLASVLGGSCTGEGPRPTPCGSACMQYSGLTDKQMAQLSRALSR